MYTLQRITKQCKRCDYGFTIETDTVTRIMEVCPHCGEPFDVKVKKQGKKPGKKNKKCKKVKK